MTVGVITKVDIGMCSKCVLKWIPSGYWTGCQVTVGVITK